MKCSKILQHVYAESECRARNYLQMLQNKGVSFAGKNVLDVGCGIGMYSNLILELGADNVTGIDIEPENISFAKQNYTKTKLQFKCTSLVDFTSPDKFDFIFARGVIYYFKNVDIFFYCVRNLMEPSGEMIISFIEKTMVTSISNIVKKISCRLPTVIHPCLMFIMACLYYPYHILFAGDKMKFSIIKSKMSTIFFPVFHLFTQHSALNIVADNQFTILQIFPRKIGTDFSFQLKYDKQA